MKRNLAASATLFFSAVLFISACNKIDTTTLGSDLIPAVDNVHTFEMVMDVITDNKLFEDSTRMLGGEAHAVGIIENDIDFGKTTATTYASFTPTAYKVYPFVKRDSVVIDSVVLSMGFSQLFGDSNSVQQIEVREINRLASFRDSLYYLKEQDFLTDAMVLGSKAVDFRTLNDTVIYRNGKDTIRSGSEMRIRLDTAWARQFVNYDTAAGQAYNSDTVFKERFKGLEIRASEGSASKTALAYFNLDDNARTRLTFYCRVQNNGRTDTIAPVFTYTSDPHANLIRRTPSPAFQENVTNGTENDEKLYVQAAPGSYVTVKIPQLDTFSNCVVHRAELIGEKYPSTEEFYAAPKLLFIDALSAAGDSSFTIRNDFAITNTFPGYDLNSIGGVYSKNKYVFNLSRYVQSIVTKKFPNPVLRIHAPFYTAPFYTIPNSAQIDRRYSFVVNDPVAFGRVMLYGGANLQEPKRMRLRIIYSRI